MGRKAVAVMKGKVVRGDERITLADIAERVGCSPTYVSLIFSGDRKGYQYRPKIAEYVGIPGQEIWGDDWLTPGAPGRPRKQGEDTHVEQ